MVASVRLAAAALLATGSLLLLPHAAPAGLPSGFAGVVPQGPLSERDLDRIGTSGLGLRLVVSWPAVEPRPGDYEFSDLDAQIGAAAERGIAVLPVVYGSPRWLRASREMPPLGARGLAAWRGLLRQLVERYGSGGDFWRGRERRRPLRRWQIWNEPNFPLFWRPRPSPAAYARLLHASAAVIRRADPRAEVVLAGLAPIEGQPPPWVFLRRLYRVPGFRADVDYVALHPYSADLGLLAERVDRTRAVMAAAGDRRKPLLITEIGVASASSTATSMDRGRRGQALYLEQAFQLLTSRRPWRVAGAYWYAWADRSGDDPTCAFCAHTGLFDLEGRPKPAWRAMLRVLGKRRPLQRSGSARSGGFGGVDRTFGRDGVVRRFLQPPPGWEGMASQVATSPGGMIYVPYWQYDYCGGRICAESDVLLRFKPDGTRDMGYGGDGAVELAAGVAGLVVDRRGRVLIATRTEGGGQLIRLLPGGAVDSSFGSGGTATISCSCPPGYLSLTLDRSGNPRLTFGGRRAGSAVPVAVVASLTARGRLDRRFGDDGMVSEGIAAGATVLADSGLAEGGGQAILASDRDEKSFTVVKLRPRGADRRFGARSERAIAAWARKRNPAWIEPRILVPRKGGGLDVVGQMMPQTGYYEGFVLRLRADGSIERGFGRGGARRLPWGVQAAIAGPGGRIFTIGEAGSTRSVAAWLDADARPIESFAGGRGAKVPEGEMLEGIQLALQRGARTLALDPGARECRTYCPPRSRLLRFTSWAPRR